MINDGHLVCGFESNARWYVGLTHSFSDAAQNLPTGSLDPHVTTCLRTSGYLSCYVVAAATVCQYHDYKLHA
jgi:hypothetical protein